MATTESPRSIEDVDHVGIVVRDADVSLEYYTSVLGLEMIHDEELIEIGVRLVYLRATPSSQTMIQLVEPIAPGTVFDHLKLHGEGLHHVCLGVRDISKALDQLGGQEEAVFLGGRGNRACFLSARPNGVILELTEKPDAPNDPSRRYPS